MNPWKVILATMIIFVCGLVTGVLVVNTTNQNTRQIAPPETVALTASNTVSTPPTNFPLITRTNVPGQAVQTQRLAVLRQMVHRLDLDPAQKERIAQIIKDSQERNKQLWEKIAPQMRQEFKRVTEDIRQQLDPQQARQFTEMLRENRRENHPRTAATNFPPTQEKTTDDQARS